MKYDVAIVGAGIIGLSHAYAAAKRGLKVLVCERTDTPLGASIRNFGFGVILGQKEGEMLNLALQSREIWGDWTSEVGIHARREGSLLIARNQLEAAVLESFMANKANEYDYNCKLLSQKEIDELYQGRFSRYSTVLHGRSDQVVFSREAIPLLVKYLSSLPNVTMKFSTLVKDINAGARQLITTQGTFIAEHIIVCSGHDYQTLLAEELKVLTPTVCRLQMMRVKPKIEFPLKHAVFTGLSCMHYEAFRDLPETETLRFAIENDYPEYVQHGIHLLVTPTPYGEFIVGDSHEYSQYPRPFSSEAIDDILLNLAKETLGIPLEIVERWVGEYGAGVDESYSKIQVDTHVTAMLMRTGLGMSIAPALGENTIAEIYD